MSFSLYAVVAEHPEKPRPGQGNPPAGRDAANCNPRTARCSGCAPAEPYPPRRLESMQTGSTSVSCQINGGTRAA